MMFRRLLTGLIVALVGVGLGYAMIRTLAPGGWTAAKILMLVNCIGAAPWVGFCAANGLIGFFLRLRRPAVPEDPPVTGPLPRTAIAVTVRNEDMKAVLPPLRRLLDGLDAAGFGDAFGLFILSDTNQAADAEKRAIAAFQTHDRDPSRVHYRRRPDNTAFKAGNIMDFLDHHAAGFDLMLVLDADSEMTPAAVLRLVTTMRDDPTLGIVQHLTVGVPASSGFPRLFQFGMRAGMRAWATALAWWQGDDCVYWGHNAVIRIAPFREHCRLPALPNGAHILSHDQIEAAILRGAGWGIRLIPEEDGSHEANPPALPEFMRRELRWLSGNFQYPRLLTLPGLRAMGRWQLIQAILLFACTPFHLFFLLAAAWAAATDTVSAFPFAWALAATLIWAGAIYAPKLLGYLEVLIAPAKRARYGGWPVLLTGIAAEILFTLMLDAINIWAKTVATLRIALGWRDPWLPQNRADRGVSMKEAARLLWPQTLVGLGVFWCFGQAGWTAVIWAAPFAGGLVLAIPFCAITADPRFGSWLRTRKIAAVPEELGPVG